LRTAKAFGFPLELTMTGKMPVLLVLITLWYFTPQQLSGATKKNIKSF
jgi:hypothetical protein